MSPDWHEWHRAYEAADSPLARRLAIVRQRIRDALDAAPPGPIHVISMCAGEARDLAGALDGHPRRGDVHGRVVELDPELGERARDNLPPVIDVLCADAGLTMAYDGVVPADLVLVCGVFGNIDDANMRRTVEGLPMLCATGAHVIWTRHRRPPDATPGLRKLFAETGFAEVTFDAPEDSMFTVGMNRFTGVPAPFRSHMRLFEFVGYDQVNAADVCAECGFSYDMGRADIIPWLRHDVRTFVERFDAIPPGRQRTRPAPDVWSPLEYACHVRDVLRVQRARVDLAQREEEPRFEPMQREARVVNDRYNEQDPVLVSAEILDSGDELIAALSALDEAGWRRTGIYNYPTEQPRTVEWVAIHTTHELLHHRVDIGTFS
jgi:hypothetical protein